MTYNKLDRKELAMTLRLSKDQNERLNEVCELLHVRTKSSAIIKMIDDYPRLIEILKKTRSELENQNSSNIMLSNRISQLIFSKVH